MKSNEYESINRGSESNGNLNFNSSQSPQNRKYVEQPEDITFQMLFQRLASGLRLLWIALKYRILKLLGLTGPRKSHSWKFSMVKLSMLAIMIILISQKDIRFSVNLKAPLASFQRVENEPQAISASNKALGQFSLGDALQMGKESKHQERFIAVSDLDGEAVNEYISRFSKVAVAEMRKFGVPASIKLAQAVLESEAGKSRSVLDNNNHFGMPLQHQEYVSAWENWRAHSLLLKTEYAALFDDAYGYKQWAKGLQKMKYSADRNYAEKLIELIEKYDLTLMDE